MVKSLSEAVRDGSLVFKPWLKRFSPERFEVDFSNVVANRGNPDYLDPFKFFELTYLTQRMKDVLQSTLVRTAGLNDKGIVYLATGFGGGKSHLLTLLYHVFNSRQVPSEQIIREIDLDEVPNVKVVTVDGKNLEYPMSDSEGFGIYLRNRMEDIIKVIKAEGKPVLFLVDELVIYLTKLNETKQKAEIANLHTFLSAVKATSNSVLVITNPSGTPVYGKAVENLNNLLMAGKKESAASDVSSVLGRVTQPIVPVEKGDFVSILRKRLIDYWDPNVAKEVEDYLSRKLNYEFGGHYPFHPAIIDVLYNRVSLFVDFQKTRDVLKVIALAIKGILTHLDYAHFHVISPSDLYFEDPDLRAILTNEKVFGSNLEQAVTQDVIASSKEQDGNVPFGKFGRIACVTFMFSLHPEPIKQGVTPKEAYLSVTDSQSDSDTEQLLGQFYSNHSTFMWFEGGKYLFKSEQNVPNMIKLAASRITSTEAERHIQNTLFKDVFESTNTTNFSFYRLDTFIPGNNRINACVLFHWEDKDAISSRLLSITADKKNTIVVVVPEGIAGSVVHYTKLVLGSEKVMKEVRNKKKLFDEAKSLKQQYEALAIQQFRGLYTRVKFLQGTAVRETDIDPHKGKTIADSIINRLKLSQKIIDRETVDPRGFLNVLLGARKEVQVRTLYSDIEIMTSVPFASRDDLRAIIRQGVKEGVICLFKGRIPDDDKFSGIERLCERVDVEVDIGDTVLTLDRAKEVKKKIEEAKKPEEAEEDEKDSEEGEDEDGDVVFPPSPTELVEVVVADTSDLYEKLRDKLSELQLADMEARAIVEFTGTIQGSVSANNLLEFRSVIDLAEGISKASLLLGSVKVSTTIYMRSMEQG